MLKLNGSPAGPRFYISPLLAAARVPHAFSTRIGGISPAPFDSLNLGNPNGGEVQDDYERIWENYRQLQHVAGCLPEKPCRVHQVHGPRVAEVCRNISFDPTVKADALTTEDPSRVLSVRIADCVPILIASQSGDRVAAVHAGWRGIISGVVPIALDALAETRPHDQFIAAIGPCIGFDAFEVGQDVLDEFIRVFPPLTMDSAPLLYRAGRPGKGYVDLREAVARQLVAAGIPAAQIDTTDRCTFRDREEFFSHRRENGITGRMAAIIQCATTYTDLT